jgi:cytochrome P450
MQETLRIHSPAVEVLRVARSDDVIPLSKPVVGISGKVYNELPIPAGTPVVASIYGYNL